jgi:hypothetical protein
MRAIRRWPAGALSVSHLRTSDDRVATVERLSSGRFIVEVMAELAFPNPPLADGVVVLRPWAADDLEFVVGAFQDPEMSLYSSSTPYPYKEADAVSWFARRVPRRLSGECIDFVVVDAESGAPLGRSTSWDWSAWSC